MHLAPPLGEGVELVELGRPVRGDPRELEVEAPKREMWIHDRGVQRLEARLERLSCHVHDHGEMPRDVAAGIALHASARGDLAGRAGVGV